MGPSIEDVFIHIYCTFFLMCTLIRLYLCWWLFVFVCIWMYLCCDEHIDTNTYAHIRHKYKETDYGRLSWCVDVSIEYIYVCVILLTTQIVLTVHSHSIRFVPPPKTEPAWICSQTTYTHAFTQIQTNLQTVRCICWQPVLSVCL